jgi:hypothetical protein
MKGFLDEKEFHSDFGNSRSIGRVQAFLMVCIYNRKGVSMQGILEMTFRFGMIQTLDDIHHSFKSFFLLGDTLWTKSSKERMFNYKHNIVERAFLVY